MNTAGSGYSETFLKTILGMLDPDANKRYQSAAEVLEDLKQNVADAESTEEVHMSADNSQQLDTAGSSQFRALWVGATIIVFFIVFGLWSFLKGEKQTEILVPETDMQAATVLQEHEVQLDESPQEKSESWKMTI